MSPTHRWMPSNSLNLGNQPTMAPTIFCFLLIMKTYSVEYPFGHFHFVATVPAVTPLQCTAHSQSTYWGVRVGKKETFDTV